MRYRNASYALVESLKTLFASGEELSVRGSKVVETRNLVVTIANPAERCYVLPERHNNVFACVAETVWVLSGRNDLEYLSHYLPRAKDFSDDGLTWRAGYGPRLRSWNQVDQIWQCIQVLQDDILSRRAVISLFDPSKDYMTSKDIPCNNWIHVLVRDGHLHMNVAIRSNDAIWGFSGINTFEWSVLHEMLAYWLHVPVGEATFFISSFHVYERHFNRARAMLDAFPGFTCYDLGMVSPPFRTPWSDFSRTLDEWFRLEILIRRDANSATREVEGFSDPLLREFLSLIRIYNGWLQGWSPKVSIACLAQLPDSDLTLAAYDFFYQRLGVRLSDIPQHGIASFYRASLAHNERRDEANR